MKPHTQRQLDALASAEGRLLLAVLVAMSIVASGCSLTSPRPAPVTISREGPRAGIRLVTLGQSVQGKPLVMHVLGSGGNPIFIFGGIHGHEPTAAQLGEQMLDFLLDHPRAWAGSSVAILPVANPDGLAKGTRQNFNGVDCNRNFAARNWKKGRPGHRYYGGPRPLSEPETRAIAEAVQTLRPKAIIAIHSMPGGKFCNNYDGPARGLAEIMARKNHYPVKASIGYPTPGSFGSWAGIDLQIPTITLELPREQPVSQVWPGNRDAILAVIQSYGSGQR